MHEKKALSNNIEALAYKSEQLSLLRNSLYSIKKYSNISGIHELMGDSPIEDDQITTLGCSVPDLGRQATAWEASNNFIYRVEKKKEKKRHSSYLKNNILNISYVMKDMDVARYWPRV